MSSLKNPLKEFKIFINCHSVKCDIHHACEIIFSLIREETENAPMSLMLDSGSRYGRNVYGVSFRYQGRGDS